MKSNSLAIIGLQIIIVCLCIGGTITKQLSLMQAMAIEIVAFVLVLIAVNHNE